jgi:glycosyltransferase involved in cell wall biosynthesis
MCYKKINGRQLADFDVVCAFFCMQNLASIRKTSTPIVYFSDTTFKRMVGYYPFFSNLPKWNIQDGIRLEKIAFEYSSAIILPSHWAVDSVISDYGVSKSKVHVIKFGANIDDKDIFKGERNYDAHLDILFNGVDWTRKGGPVALEAVEWLNNHGVSSTLHIVGIKKMPEECKKLNHYKYYGFLDKNNPSEYAKLVELLHKCHILLLPTMAECVGIAFVEASANGLPSFTYDTGGISDYVKNGKNGYLLPLGSSGCDFGKKIKECVMRGELPRMAELSKIEYSQRLNWNMWKEKIYMVIRSLIES